MKAFKEIKRRVRNAAKALAGLEMQPVEIALPRIVFERQELHTQDFQVERIISPRWSISVPLRDIENEMAKELGRGLLEAGAIVVNVNELREEPGERVRLRVRVVMPSNQIGRPTRTEKEGQK